MGDEKLVIYPAYIDSRASRSRGRRVPSQLAVPGPTPEEIYAAAAKLGLNPVLEPDKVHPSGRYRGRVLVDKRMPKGEVLRRIAEEIKGSRKIQ